LVVGDVILTTGAVRSGKFLGAVYVTARVLLAVFPELSVAVTVRVFNPAERGIHDTDQDVVPVAVPLEPELFVHFTVDSPTLSLAVPEREMLFVVVVYVLLIVGEVIATTGIVISGIV